MSSKNELSSLWQTDAVLMNKPLYKLLYIYLCLNCSSPIGLCARNDNKFIYETGLGWKTMHTGLNCLAEAGKIILDGKNILIRDFVDHVFYKEDKQLQRQDKVLLQQLFSECKSQQFQEALQQRYPSLFSKEALDALHQETGTVACSQQTALPALQQATTRPDGNEVHDAQSSIETTTEHPQGCSHASQTAHSASLDTNALSLWLKEHTFMGSRLATQFFSKDSLKQLKSIVRFVYLFISTNARTSCLGVMTLTPLGIAVDAGTCLQTIKKSLAALTEAKLAIIDDKSILLTEYIDMSKGYKELLSDELADDKAALLAAYKDCSSSRIKDALQERYPLLFKQTESKTTTRDEAVDSTTGSSHSQSEEPSNKGAILQTGDETTQKAMNDSANTYSAADQQPIKMLHEAQTQTTQKEKSPETQELAVDTQEQGQDLETSDANITQEQTQIAEPSQVEKKSEACETENKPFLRRRQRTLASLNKRLLRTRKNTLLSRRANVTQRSKRRQRLYLPSPLERLSKKHV